MGSLPVVARGLIEAFNGEGSGVGTEAEVLLTYASALFGE